MKHKQLEELILQSLEHEFCGVDVYTTASKCVRNADLKEEWETAIGAARAEKLSDAHR